MLRKSVDSDKSERVSFSRFYFVVLQLSSSFFLSKVLNVQVFVVFLYNLNSNPNIKQTFKWL